MKLGIILLITISGVLLASSLQQADSQLLASGKYLLQGSGFAATEESIDDSALDLQFSTGKLVNTRMTVTLQDGLISFSNDDYIAASGWTGMVLGNGKFISLSGDAENANGDKISLTLLARLVQNSKDSSVYSVTGKLTQNGESTKLIYNAKVTGSSIVKETPTQQEAPKEKTIQISILQGSSKPGNIQYYSLPTVQITPGTTIVWKNDDTVSHR
ncbi:MAG: cupredoxin domain-containing protein, partial [Nitrosopumilaceae archaeon]